MPFGRHPRGAFANPIQTIRLTQNVEAVFTDQAIIDDDFHGPLANKFLHARGGVNHAQNIATRGSMQAQPRPDPVFLTHG